MKLYVGLGNPGKEYQETRHNIGFMVIDEFAKSKSVSKWEGKHQSLFATFQENNEKILLVKPQTYMNLSGNAVAEVIKFYKIHVEDMVVIYDDLDLNVGQIRLREQGSSGGHNGIKSMIQLLGTEKFNRIKIGIGRPISNQTSSYVLGKFLPHEKEAIELAKQKSVEACSYFLENNFITCMNRFNKKD